MVSPQLPEGSEEMLDTLQEDLHHGQRGQNGSSEAPVDSPYSLKIENTATCNSGTYRCTLQEPGGQRNISATVILKVTGEVTHCPCFLLAKRAGALSVGREIHPLFPSLTLRLPSHLGLGLNSPAGMCLQLQVALCPVLARG